MPCKKRTRQDAYRDSNVEVQKNSTITLMMQIVDMSIKEGDYTDRYLLRWWCMHVAHQGICEVEKKTRNMNLKTRDIDNRKKIQDDMIVDTDAH